MIRLSDLQAFILAQQADGNLGSDPEIRIRTGWDGPQELSANAMTVSEEDGARFVLIEQ